ncbi:uncharacterized protein LOC122403031 [Colletes gigas]|uniref:uncharacterized protein LOC122403031 n=1 Tax=Colletes gigas TaxID=935657 RepID=UPI001C9ADB3F|nr:uncharacterized protein LOC122403031 [Colletes gigas]
MTSGFLISRIRTAKIVPGSQNIKGDAHRKITTRDVSQLPTTLPTLQPWQSASAEDAGSKQPQLQPQALYDSEYLAAVSKPQLPAFMKERPDIWFYLIEAEFAAARTRSDDVKYNATLRALDPDTLHQITDIISTPPTTNKYATLKQTIIKRVAESRQKQMYRLLNDLVLGDKKPSQLLREMRDLAADSINKEMLHNLWVSRLPNSIRPLLIISDALKLDALAEMADRLMETVTLSEPNTLRPLSTMAAVSQSERPKTPPPSALAAQLTELQSAMAFCMKTILDVQKQQQQQQQMFESGRSNHRGRSMSRSQDRNRRSSSQQGSCYYHRRFGQDAKRCTTPCTYKTHNQGN